MKNLLDLSYQELEWLATLLAALQQCPQVPFWAVLVAKRLESYCRARARTYRENEQLGVAAGSAAARAQGSWRRPVE